MADLPSYLAMDDRYGDIPLAFEWAVIYISNSLKTYDGDVFKTLVAYNAGGGTVTSFVNSCGEDGWYNCYANSPKYGQKHNYVKLVLRYFNEDLATNDLKFSGTSSSLSSMLSTKFELKTGEIHYNRDLFSYQNSGVEFYKPRMTMSRDDVKMLLTNNYNFGKDVYEPHANKYDLLSLFTQREVYDRSGAQGGGMSWIGMNAAIGSLGQKSTRTIPAEFKFAHIAPLIPMNSPTGRDLSSERISSQFGMRNLGGNEMHKGIDIAIPVGTPLYSVAPGRVAVSAFNDGGYGWYVKVEHVLPERLEDRIITSSDNKQYEVVKIHTVYAHNSSLKVKVGDVISDDCSKITDGARCINIQDPIAYSGNTGRSYGPHLHFEVDLTIKDLETGKQLPAIRANRNVDPLFWLTTQWNG
jgi:murein DD-endopeptidase MepM/ murein hydrolase activator NlpD